MLICFLIPLLKKGELKNFRDLNHIKAFTLNLKF